MMVGLECDHCGGTAIESEDGRFRDGDGGACMSCGLPGCVMCDAETPPYWAPSDDPDVNCNDPDCLDCRELNA